MCNGVFPSSSLTFTSELTIFDFSVPLAGIFDLCSKSNFFTSSSDANSNGVSP